MKINLSSYGSSKKRPWLTALQKKFASDHELTQGHVLTNYLATPGGAKEFANWVKASGYDAKFWCLEPSITYDHYGRKNITHIGFGIDINERCPLFVELRLKT